MRIHHRLPSSPRPAFTLVELIVAIAIIAVLAALAVMIFPRLQDSQQIPRGADQVQGTLFIARQMAMRDQLPRGVRLVPTLDQADNVYRVHTLQYIEQPAYFLAPAGSALVGMSNPPNPNPPPPGLLNPNIGIFTSVDFYGGNGPGNPFLWPVQPGDYLDLMGNNKPDGLYKILSVNVSTNPQTPTISDNLTLMSALPLNLLAVQPPQQAPPPVAFFQNLLSYRILRGPRPMIGQPPINLPADVVVDLPTNNVPPVGSLPAGGLLVHPLANNTPGSLMQADNQTGQFDILFSPSGKVLRDAGSTGKVVLWVWNSTGTNPMAQEQVLVVIYTRTGMVASQPVDLRAGGDPYSFIKDGRASGM